MSYESDTVFWLKMAGLVVLWVAVHALIVINRRDEITDMKVEGIRQGQCSQMYLMLQTGSLKEPEPVQTTFDELCKGYRQ